MSVETISTLHPAVVTSYALKPQLLLRFLRFSLRGADEIRTRDPLSASEESDVSRIVAVTAFQVVGACGVSVSAILTTDVV
jgi:hypothetical protein